MTPRFVGALLLIIFFACVATGIIVYPNLPLMMASHWDIDGQVNGVTSRFWSTALLPLGMLVIIGLWAVVPKIDPIANGFRSSRYVYDFSFFLVVSFLAYVYALTLGENLGWRFDMSKMILPTMAVFIFLLGSILPSIRRNWFVGIRTPWTVSSDVVWNKTHRLGRILFQVSAISIFAGAFMPKPAAHWFVFVPLIGAAVISVVYSYILFMKEKRS